MKFEHNPYYSPEKCGLSLLYSIDTAGSYEFDMIAIWEKLDDNTIWWDTDSGCSCPVPFENERHDLKEITTDTYYNFKLALENQTDIKQEDIIEAESVLKKFVRDYKLDIILK